jgi:hydrogenase expression/formation protein HypD
MKYIDEFRSITLAQKLAGKIKAIAPQETINFMEVCGTHTQSFRRFGLNKILPPNLRLIAGPGCPVCVSSQEYIDNAIKLTQHKDVIILTFGDMLRIPGSVSTLEKEKARYGNVRVAYSALEAIGVARRNPDKKVIFLAVGFETTAPTIALSIIAAKKENLSNLFFFSSLKLIPPAMSYLLRDKRLKLNGFLCPGHVSTIIGTRPYEFIPKKYAIGCCISGFEPLDILGAIFILLSQIKENKPRVENQYSRVVTRSGNLKAQKIIAQVFKTSDAYWRGLGRIPNSGLKIRDEFSKFDIEKVLNVSERGKTTAKKQKKCRCADILKGLISPLDCPLFSKACYPENPIGPCMVSAEGACNAYYKYK